MDPGERGRGGYNRGGRGRGRGQGYRGQGRGGHRPENERGYEELHGDPAGGSFRGQANRGGGFPQRGGRGGNRGGVGPRPRGEGYQDINTDFQHGPRGPPMHPPYGMSGPNMGPRPFDPNIRPPPNIRGPANPQQMQMNFPPNQMPPISQMQDYDEVEITYRVKPRQNPPQQVPFQQQYQQQSFNSPPPPLLGNIGPQNNNPRRNPRSQQVPLQQQYQQPNTSVPPPPLLENPGPQYSNQRAGSMMDIRNSAADNFKRHGSREQLSRGESYQNLPRSSSVQNVGGMRGRGGSRQNQHILNRGRGRGGHPQQDRSYSQDNLNQRHFNDSNQGQRERMENQNYTSENNLDDSSAGRRNIVRGQRRRRGRGYRDNNRERNTEPINDETEVNDKENEDIQRNDRRVRGRGGGRLRGRCPGRGRRGCNNNREHISDTKGSDKENESEGEDENSGERSTVSIRNNRRDRQTIRGRGRGRGGQFYPRGSFRGRFGYRGRHRPDMLVSRGRSNSESSDVSIVSTLTDTTETESVPDAASDPTRAGVLGIQSISIQTLKNRLYRYKRKLTGFKKKENPDLDEIEKLQEEINEIDTVIQRRIREEKDSKSVKSNDTEEAVEEASDESDDGTVHQHSPVQQRRLKVVGSSKKGMVSFRPKTKLKGAKASNKKPTGSVNTQRVPEEDIQSSSSDYCDLTESGDHDKKLEENSKPESAKTRRNRRRKKPDREPKTLEPTSKDVPDWQEMLEGLCSADPGIRNATNDESKGAKPKINRKQPEEEIPKIAKQHNEASQNKGTEKDLGKNDKKLNKGRKKRDQIQKEKAQQADAQTANEGIKPKCHNERTRSGSSVSDSSIDADPDEIEVFKFIVKDMKGQGSIRDIQSKCSLLNRYQGNLDEWFKRHSRKFAIFKKETKIIKVCAYVKDAEYCLDYITRRGCSKDGCHRYHICKNLLCGLCSFGEKCKFSHNTNDEHNGRIQCQQDFKNVFNNEQIIDILSLRFPHVCESWNIEGSCPDTTCCKLHICRKHVFGDCLEGDGCPFEHSLTTVQNSMITDAYHMSKWVPKLFNKIIFVLKRPPPHVISNTPDGTFAGETNEGVETQEVLYSRRQCGGIETEELTVPRPAPRPAPRKLHTRPGRKACQTDNEG